MNHTMLNVTGKNLMAKQLSTHAAAAKMIRQHLKSIGVPCKVRSESYSGGTSINVKVGDVTPALRKELLEYVDQFQYGRFNGMTDSYEYANCRADIPQVQYTFLNVDYAEETRQKAYEFICNRFSVGEVPKLYTEASWSLETTCGSRIRDLVDSVLTGYGFENASKEFWASIEG